MRENMIPCPEEARGDVEVSLQDRDSFPKIPGILAKKKPWYNIVRKKSTYQLNRSCARLLVPLIF